MKSQSCQCSRCTEPTRVTTYILQQAQGWAPVTISPNHETFITYFPHYLLHFLDFFFFFNAHLAKIYWVLPVQAQKKAPSVSRVVSHLPLSACCCSFMEFPSLPLLLRAWFQVQKPRRLARAGLHVRLCPEQSVTVQLCERTAEGSRTDVSIQGCFQGAGNVGFTTLVLFTFLYMQQ